MNRKVVDALLLIGKHGQALVGELLPLVGHADVDGVARPARGAIRLVLAMADARLDALDALLAGKDEDA